MGVETSVEVTTESNEHSSLVTSTPGEFVFDELTPFTLVVEFEEHYTQTTIITTTTTVTEENKEPVVSSTYVTNNIQKSRPATILSVVPQKDYGVTISFTQNVLTVVGPFTKAFVRDIKYLDSSNNKQIATDFVSLPAEYNALYQYAIYPQTTTIATFTITFQSPISKPRTFLCTVNHKWEIANPILVEHVKKGKY